MTWVKLDEHFVDHPKVITAGPLASWLFVAGLCYANRLLTNGFIPKDQLDRLVVQNGTHRQDPVKLAHKLCEVNLWKPATIHGQSGYQIHDFLRYQPSRRQVLKARKMGAERQARYRQLSRRMSQRD
jgi:hypothetical protein